MVGDAAGCADDWQNSAAAVIIARTVATATMATTRVHDTPCTARRDMQYDPARYGSYEHDVRWHDMQYGTPCKTRHVLHDMPWYTRHGMQLLPRNAMCDMTRHDTLCATQHGTVCNTTSHARHVTRHGTDAVRHIMRDTPCTAWHDMQ